MLEGLVIKLIQLKPSNLKLYKVDRLNLHGETFCWKNY